MKLLLALAFILLGLPGFAQQTEVANITPSMKYSKPSEEELKMTTYSLDTAATEIGRAHV